MSLTTSSIAKSTVASYFLGIFSAAAPPYNFFLAATFLLYIMNLFEVKRKKLGWFESLMFVAELPVNSAVVALLNYYALSFEHAQQFHISHFSYHLRYYMVIYYC